MVEADGLCLASWLFDNLGDGRRSGVSHRHPWWFGRVVRFLWADEIAVRLLDWRGRQATAAMASPQDTTGRQRFDDVGHEALNFHDYHSPIRVTERGVLAVWFPPKLKALLNASSAHRKDRGA